MKPDEQRMRDVLVDTIRLLCRTGIDYSRRLRVQGLLGITVDDEHVFLIHVDDLIARNCTEVDTGLCGFADECSSASRAHVNSDLVSGASIGSVDHHSVSQDITGNCTKQCQLTPAVQHQKRPLSQSSHNDILTSVAMSEISSVVATSADIQDFPSSQMLSETAQNVLLFEHISPLVAGENCNKLAHFVSNGNTTAAKSCATELSPTLNMPQTSVPNEVVSNNRSEIQLPVFVKTDVDGREDGRPAESIVMTSSDDLPHSDLAMCTAAVGSENRGMLSNLDDVDSSSDDGDSDHSSESDDVSDHLPLPPLELISSLQYKSHALAGNASQWQIGGIQQPGGSDTGTDPVTIQPATVLTGVTGSHASAYYQQQILAAAAAAAHNRAARAAATSVKSVSSATESTTSVQPLLPLTVKHKPPSSSSSCTFQRRLPRRPRESQDKRFRCPFCELAYYHKKHLKYHLSKKHGF